MDKNLDEIKNLILKLKTMIHQKDDKISKLTKENIKLKIKILELMEEKITNNFKIYSENR